MFFRYEQCYCEGVVTEFDRVHVLARSDEAYIVFLSVHEVLKSL